METKSVLNDGFVRLVDVMGDDSSIVQAARVSYGKGTKTIREDKQLIDYLMRHRHTSPFEMVEFKFHVRAPIFVARQWFRHRTASVNEVSLRYSKAAHAYYVPESWRLQSSSNKQGSESQLDAEQAEAMTDLYVTNVDDALNVYEYLLEVGVAREQARTLLPLGLYTEFYWKQDLHNLLHFLKLRLDAHAQWEIRQYAQAIYELIKVHVPLTIEAWENHVLKAVSLSADEQAVLIEALLMLDVDMRVLENELKRVAKERGFRASRTKELVNKLDQMLEVAHG